MNPERTTIDPDRRRAGLRLAAARKAKGWTQQEFAVKLGVPLSTVGRWECGERTISATLLRAVAEILECEPLQFLP